jgi:RNA polymerase sigma factor (sigma-70 family)
VPFAETQRHTVPVGIGRRVKSPDARPPFDPTWASRRGVGSGDPLVTDAGPAPPFARLRAALARTIDPRTDGQLLTAFVRHRDADAFAALVYRHGPRVLGVCRRVTGHAHDADDAFQAVFLVLARRAADVTPPDAVAVWLYGVAVRTAQDARVMAARRRSRVTPTDRVPDVPEDREPEPPDAELAAALDAEIAALPDHYRAAVVLCELTGVSRADAAKRLGVPEGTLSSRLAEARKRLAAGLRRKGFALPTVLTAAVATDVSGSEPVFLAACRWGSLTVAGGTVPAGVPVTLADRMTRIMYLKKLTLLGVLTACGLLVATGWLTLHRAFADAPPAVKAAGAKPKATAGRLLVWTHGNLKLLDPDGKNETLVLDRDRKSVSQAVLSPDGKSVAWLMHIPAPPGTPLPVPLPKNTVHVSKLDEKEPTDLKIIGEMLAWSPDGKELMVTDFVDGPLGANDGPPKTTTTVIDVASKKESATGVPNDHFAFGFTPDGKGFVTMHYEKKGDVPVLSVCLVSRDGKDVKVVSDPKMLAYLARLSPDGKTLLYRGHPAPDKLPEKPLGNMRLYVQPVGGKAVEVADVPQNAEIQGYCWSPDGKRIAYTWRQVHAVKPEAGKVDDRETESHLVVCDADGKNATTILTEKGMAQYHVTLSHVDWR